LLGENDDEAETVDDDLVNMAVSMQVRALLPSRCRRVLFS
jgi:hypothetical protein